MPCSKCGSKNQYQDPDAINPCGNCFKSNVECEECTLEGISILVCRDCGSREFDD